MTRIPLVAVGLLLLGGCGAARDLEPRAGDKPPPAAYGATAAPTARQLITPSPQARPARSDELLRNSDERRGDAFDLPPPN